MITENPTHKDTSIVSHGSAAPVYVGDNEPAVVEIAVDNLQNDVNRVSGVRPAVVDDVAAVAGTAIVVGTVGRSNAVQECLRASDVNPDAFESDRESFVIETLEQPPVDAESCLLIAGSDRRGTAFGVYELSKEIGVSPWHWWADVPPKTRETIAVERGSYRFGPPSVTYRGIFLNDEDWGLRPWASETFAPEDATDRPGLGPKTYERVFELLLRLKANTVWPAMHPDTKAFYRYPENARLADRYAIVIGTSHCEPMHRNNIDEWDEEEMGKWNYAENEERIREYWRSRVEDVTDYENVFTIGMRGTHDGAMAGGETRSERVQLLQEVIGDQRQILEEAHDAPVESVPQVFCPYKEVLELFRSGLDVPEDVCVMWPDDNHGYLRELPTATERGREGGSGVYYHLSYFGSPHDYLWLSSVTPGLVRHEMRRAHAAGARECWVVNVGDIKPTEKEMEFFLDLAWDIDGPAGATTEAWLERWAAREFGDSIAPDVASILSEYYRLCQARKPEHMGWTRVFPSTEPDDPGYSFVAAGDEARRRVEAFEAIEQRATEIYEMLDEAHQPAFYELVLYPVRCAGLMSEKFLHAARGRLYAGQGRETADRYADAARDAHEQIQTETRYYNKELLDGKWNRMISASPRDLPVFDEPVTASVETNERTALGVAAEGRRPPVRADAETPPSLPVFDRFTDQQRFVDVFARGTEPVEWTATTSHDWIETSRSVGTCADEQRFWIGIDWEAAPDEHARGTVTVSGAGEEKSIGIEARPIDEGLTADFVETSGGVALEAEEHSRREDGASESWAVNGPPGRVSGTTMAVTPAVFDSYLDDIESAPRLEFDLAVTSTGDVEVEVQCAPTQALNSERDLRYAVAFDDQDPQIVSLDVSGGQENEEWKRNVLRGASLGTSSHDIETNEPHTLNVWALDPGLVFDRICVYAGGDRETYLGPAETKRSDSRAGRKGARNL